MVVIIFGVSGAGKTTIGQLLAEELGWRFYEGDDFHSQTNIDKMHHGIPLTDEDRRPWLKSLRKLIKRCLGAGENAVLTCSALKEAYRRHLRVSDNVKLVFLRGNYELVANQLRQRRRHFMNPALLQSQFADFEEPQPTEGVLVIELGRSPRELVQEIKRKLRPSQKRRPTSGIELERGRRRAPEHN
jgi:gluconokinase